MNNNKIAGKRNAHLRTQLTRWGRLLFKTLAVMATLTILASLAGVVATAHTPTLEWTDRSYPRF
ncbi:MAG: hypothetical protein GY832_10895, partial [Chloroflexi bacterium]|nr:hypothetical protein [Chloroflexota bacterium]